jgi:ABC-type uncharacterized transport system ATPase subunit
MRWLLSILLLVALSRPAPAEVNLSCTLLTSQLPYLVSLDDEAKQARIGNSVMALEKHPYVYILIMDTDFHWKINRVNLNVTVIRRGLFVTRGTCDFIRDNPYTQIIFK